MKKDLAYYRSLPYHLEVEQFEEDEEDGEIYYRAYYEEIPRVQGIHKDRLMAKRLAKDLFDSYVEAQLEWGQEIPEPEPTRFRTQGGRWMFKTYEMVRSGSTAESAEGQPDSDSTPSTTGSDVEELAVAR